MIKPALGLAAASLIAGSVPRRARLEQSGPRPPIRLVDMPAFNDDGRKTLARADPAFWAPAVSALLEDIAKPSGRWLAN